MGMGTRAGVIACAVLFLCPVALSRVDDDFAFDNSDEFQVELTANHSEITKNSLRRLWGVPDTSAYVGHLFRMEIPKEAFSGEVVSYKVRSEDGRRVPSWLAIDSRHGLISGIPQQSDVGAHTFTVTAHGRTHGFTASDSFTIEVKKAEDKPQSKYGSCRVGENRLVLVILVDGAFGQIAPRQRIRALMELASFMALDGDEFWMEPYKADSAQWQSVLMSGSGTTQRKRGDATTAIYVNVGCGEKLWARHKVLLGGVREQARDGSLATTLRLPVLGWRLVAAKPLQRPKRQSPLDDGSGTYDTYGDDDDAGDYSGYDDDDDDYTRADADIDVTQPVDPKPEPRTPLTTLSTPQPPTTPSHPHRHHHGDYGAPHTSSDVFQTEDDNIITSKSTTTSTTPPTSTITIPTTTVTTNPVSHTTPSQTPVSFTASNSHVSVVLNTAPVSPTDPPSTTPPTAEEITTEATTTETVSTNSYTTEEHKIQITPYSEPASSASNVNASHVSPSNTPRRLHSPVVIVPEEVPTTSEPDVQTVIIRASNEIPVTSPSPPPPPPSTTEEVVTSTETIPTLPTSPTTVLTSPMTPTTVMTSSTTVPTTPVVTYPVPVPTTVETTTAVPETTIEEVTEQDTMTTTERSSTIIGRTTETVTFAMPVNQPPTLGHHMKKLAITSGKAFRYIIPADLFTDPEQGSNLTFTMHEVNKPRLSPQSWVQFIPKEREVYGLPLEADVSLWNFIVEARDNEGLTASGPLDITVQQHKGVRTINHHFILKFKLNRPFSNAVDWQIRALEGIVNLFRDTDMEQLTVLNATKNGDICEFVWTNDTLPRDAACPLDDIKRLMKIMESDSVPGSPSAGLVRAMSPELKVASVSWRGVGRCAFATHPPPPLNMSPPYAVNAVDHLTATVGHLLVFKVPEDTFVDVEDGATRNLHLSLRYEDLSEIPTGHWLQFDEKNQEFYGLPTTSDEGSVHCLLIAEDSSKNQAYDSLVVDVVKAPAIKPSVEFQMTMEYPFPSLAYNAQNKRKVVEKLAELFGQTGTENIRIQSITDNPTTIIWYNTSLPMDRCPKEEIEALRNMIITDDPNSGSGALREQVDSIFDKDFKVMSIRLIPLGLCAEQNTKTPKIVTPVLTPKMGPENPELTPTNTQSSKAGTAVNTEYLVTFIIPAIVIVCMIIVAGAIACVLYKRRRTGKMSVGDEEERQAFRSKGIPVIFQDELDERNDSEPVHKSPVIMREEKPPLLPPAPDYNTSRSSDDAPYRPPPPFAASRTPPRPKATPTYRKPPPYVPP